MGKKKKKGGAAATPSLKDCANCGAPEGTVPGVTIHKPCDRCEITFYCSVKCQKHHWKEGGHKQLCMAMEERSVEKARAEATKSTSGPHKVGAAAEEDICAICQYPLSESPSKRLSCSHVYHSACLEKLRSHEIKQACPMCRVDLPAYDEATHRLLVVNRLWKEGIRRWMVLDRRYNEGNFKPWRQMMNADDRRENTKIVRMMEKAAEQRSAFAQEHLAHMCAYGKGLPQNYALAAEWWRKAADQGDAQAQSCLGNMYFKGRGMPQSDALAEEWWRKAADQGFAAAQCEIGILYEKGRGGLPQNHALAVEWYRKAADQEFARAQSCLGLMYFKGRGMPQSEALAAEWWRKAADQGNARAQCNLGNMYLQGWGGLPQSDALAIEWLHKAADQGDLIALQELIVLYLFGGQGGPRRNFQEVQRLCSSAVAHAAAQLELERWWKNTWKNMKFAAVGVCFALAISLAISWSWYRFLCICRNVRGVPVGLRFRCL